MDNVTHALAGCFFAELGLARIARTTGTEPSPKLRRGALLLGIISAEIPDADLVYAGSRLGIGKLGYLLHHRGHTHTALFALLAGLLIWLIAVSCIKAPRPPGSPGDRPPNSRWRDRLLRRDGMSSTFLALALAGTFSHIALDWTNNYGVHPWWPINSRWYYGDGVFIVEPWLWIASIPPLFFLARSAVGKATYTVLLGAILVAAWRVTLVRTDVATVLTVAAGVWALAASRLSDRSRRVAVGMLWMAVECTFFAGTGAGRRLVRQTVGTPLRDVVVTPSPGDPLCQRALIASVEGDRYRLTTATVAPFPRLRSVTSCGDLSLSLGGTPVVGPGSASLAWGEEWEGSVADLRALAKNHCDAAAALQFVRMPLWRRLESGTVRLSDARFGEGDDAFASVVLAPAGAPCPRYRPAWRPPRQDVLE